MLRHLIKKAVLAFFVAAGTICFADTASVVAQSKLLAAGKKALEEGKTDKAINLLTKAVKSNELSNEEIAQALYQRGLAYKRQQKTAAAIADLNGALFIKSLPPKERQQALTARAEIFSSIGQTKRAAADLGNAAKTASRSNQEGSTKSGSVPDSSNKQVNIANKSQSPNLSAGNNRLTTQSISKNPNENSSQISSGFETQTIRGIPENNSATQTAQSGGGSFSGVTSFFKNLISPSPSQNSKRQVKKSVNNSNSANTVNRTTDSAAGWSVSTNVNSDYLKTASIPEERQTTSGRKQVVSNTLPKRLESKKQLVRSKENKISKTRQAKVGNRVNKSPEQTNAAQLKKKTGKRENLKEVQKVASKTVQPRALKVNTNEGRYRLNLASTRNVDDAIATWKQLSNDHRDLLQGRNGEIQQVETSESGTIYNVRIGPFSDQAKTVRLCQELRQRGVGCDLSKP